MKVGARVLIAVTLIAGVILWVYASAGGAEPYQDVYQIVGSETATDDEVAVKGVVVENSTTVDGDTITFRLRDASNDLAREHLEIEVVYTGVLPDAFGPKLVVVSGTLESDPDENGVPGAPILRAESIQVGCSSKY